MKKVLILLVLLVISCSSSHDDETGAEARIAIASITPRNGVNTGGTIVTVRGAGLLGADIRFGGQAAKKILSNDGSTLICIVPPKKRNSKILATVISGDTRDDAPFEYVENKSICAVQGSDCPRICSDGAGGAFVTWDVGAVGSRDVYAQRINGNGNPIWTSPASICVLAGDQYVWKICQDGAGGSIIPWIDTRNGSYDIYAQRIDGNGAALWPENGVPVCVSPKSQYTAMAISDGAEGAIIAWEDTRNGSYDIYAQRIDGNGAALWTLNGVAVCNDPKQQSDHCLVSDGAGGAIIAWHDNRSGNYDIYAQRIDGNGAALWTLNGVKISDSPGNDIGPSLIYDGERGAIIAWFQNSTESNVYTRRIGAGGSLLWPVTVICSAGGDQRYPTLAKFLDGSAVVAWEDSRSGNYDVYAQRLDMSGSALWADGGLLLCSAAGDQRAVAATEDNDGIVVAWHDGRNGASDIYAQRVDSTGTALWAVGGQAISTATGDQKNPVIVGNGKGALIVWRDFRGGGASEIYGGQTINQDQSLGE